MYQSLSAGNFVGQRVNAVRSGEWVFCRGNAIKCVFTETIANKIHLIKEIAGIIQNKLYQAFGTSNAGIRSEDELYVLRHSTMPAVLIETGFISNDFDRSVLTDSAKLKQGAAAVADAIEEIIKISKEG